MHEHNDCQHELKYCEHCDVVYCKKCKREWGKTQYVYTYPWWNWQPSSSEPYKVTCNGVITDGTSASGTVKYTTDTVLLGCNHA